MADTEKQNGEKDEQGIDYGGKQADIDKAKAKAAEDDRKRLEEEHA